MSGSTIGGVIGGVVGVWIGIGWQAGWAIGSAIGGYVDPQQIQGPRLGDARVQTSRDGIPIPYGWGTFPIAGNVIWQADPIKRTKTEKQGKGGPEVTTEYWTRSYAIGVCEGEITGFLQIYRNKKLVYDARDTETVEEELREGGLTAVEAAKLQVAKRAEMAKFKYKCAMYTGSETQDPDPTIEGYLGVDNVPAYPGMAYIVVTDDDSIDGEIAQYDFVVSRCGTIDTTEAWGVHPVNWMIQSDDAGRLYVSEDGLTWTTSYHHTLDYRYVTTYGDSIILSNRATAGTNASYSNDFGVTISPLSGWPTQTCAPPLVLPSGRIVVLGISVTAAVVYYSDDPFNPSGWTSVSLGMGAQFIAGDDSCIIVSNGTDRKVSTTRGATFGSSMANGVTISSLGHKDGLFVFGGSASTMPRWSDDNGVTLNVCTGTVHSTQSVSMFPMPDGSWVSLARRVSVSTTDNIARSPDGKTGWATVTTPSMYFEASEAQRIAERGGLVIAAGNVGGFLSIIKSLDYGATWSSVPHGYSGFTVHDGIGVAAFPFRPDDAINIPDAPGFYTQPDGTIIYPDYETLTPCIPTLAEIVADICELSGLTSDEYDVSELTDLVPGFVVARETDAASVIGVLSMAYFFDPAEWDGKLRFVKRSGNSVLSINSDDLVRRDGDPFERERAQEAEFLRRSTISYIDPATGYAPTTQKWERRAGTVRALGESSFEVPVTLEGDAAATITKRRGLIPWGEPEKQKLSLPYRLAALTTTDIITYTSDDSEIHTIRLMQTEDDSGIRQIEATTNCAEAYNATATGSTPKAPTISAVNLLGPTILKAMNLDSLQAQDNVPGMYFAATGISPGWPGCIVEMSKDDGDTFEPIVTITSPATMGYLLDSIGTSVIDSNGDPIPPEPIQVFLYANGQLSSATPAQITAGVNASAIVTANVAEIIQFETATAVSTATYDLTDTIRGVGDTTEATHFYGDAFVILNSAVIFVPIDSGLSGTTLIFRAVTIGTPSESATEIPVPYEPPTFVIDGGGA